MPHTLAMSSAMHRKSQCFRNIGSKVLPRTEGLPKSDAFEGLQHAILQWESRVLCASDSRVLCGESKVK